MTDQTNKLKPCPWCGGTVHLWGVEEHGYFAACNTDGCYGENQAKHGRVETIDAWNRRASAPAAGSAPSDHDIEMLATGFAVQHRNGLLKFARALLAQYGGAAWQPIETAPRDCAFLGYQRVNDDMWIIAPMYLSGVEYLFLQFHSDNSEHVANPTHWKPIPKPPAIDAAISARDGK